MTTLRFKVANWPALKGKTESINNGTRGKEGSFRTRLIDADHKKLDCK